MRSTSKTITESTTWLATCGSGRATSLRVTTTTNLKSTQKAVHVGKTMSRRVGVSCPIRSTLIGNGCFMIHCIFLGTPIFTRVWDIERWIEKNEFFFSGAKNQWHKWLDWLSNYGAVRKWSKERETHWQWWVTGPWINILLTFVNWPHTSTHTRIRQNHTHTHTVLEFIEPPKKHAGG